MMYVLALLCFVAACNAGTIDIKKFQQDCLSAHNTYRAKHKNTPPMALSDAANKYAQSRADHMAQIDTMVHDGTDQSFGENLYSGSGTPTGQGATDMWYAEIKSYNFAKPGFSGSTGHFTQLVWAASTELGCGAAQGKKGWYVSCNYRQRGNMVSPGYFEKNVNPLK